jgi:hypothetical protein
MLTCTALQAEEKRATEEAELAARLAYEARVEFEREEANRLEAKAALKQFLLKWVPARTCPWRSAQPTCKVLAQRRSCLAIHTCLACLQQRDLQEDQGGSQAEGMGG